MPKNQSQRILYLVTLSEWGGAQTYVYDLATDLSKSSTVIVACGGDQNGELIRRIKKENIKLYYLKNLDRSINFYRDWLAFWDLVKLFKTTKPDIVHLNSSKAGSLGALAAKLAKVPKVVYTVHGLVLNEPLGNLKRIFFWLSEWISGKCKDKLICVSDYDKRSLLANKIVPSSKIAVIHNGIDLTRLDFFEKDESLYKIKKLTQLKTGRVLDLDQPKTNVVGTIANFYSNKGLIYLIEAAKEALTLLPNTKFVIIGDGPGRRKITSLIESYKLENSIFLLGIIEKAAKYLKAFDIFVLPSVKEGLSYTLIEAVSAGLPIITTNVGGSSEIVKHKKNGILVPPKQFNILAENIVNLIQNSSSRKLFIKNNMLEANRFDLKQMIAETKIIYNQ
jgi:glycosyltransferase involved in cell wall biosynthesis